MKAVGKNIVIDPIKETTTKTNGGLILGEKQREDIRYRQAKVIEVGDDIKEAEDESVSNRSKNHACIRPKLQLLRLIVTIFAENPVEDAIPVISVRDAFQPELNWSEKCHEEGEEEFAIG